MRQFFKKAVAVVLTGVLLAGASISAAAAPQELSVTPTVASGEAAVEGDVITLTEGKAATVAFQPSQELDIIEYQYSLAQPSDTNETIVDVTDWETADSLVPAYSFSGLKEGTYQITLTLTENTGYTTVFQKEYTVKVQAAPVPDPDIERDKEVLVYDPSVHHYESEKPYWSEVRPGHFVWANDPELAEYRTRLK